VEPRDEPIDDPARDELQVAQCGEDGGVELIGAGSGHIHLKWRSDTPPTTGGGDAAAARTDGSANPSLDRTGTSRVFRFTNPRAGGPMRTRPLHPSISALVALGIVALGAGAPVTLPAQAGVLTSPFPTAGRARGLADGVVFETVGTSRTAWPIAEASTRRDGFMTVVAITPGIGKLAVQVLWPVSPADSGWTRGDAYHRIRAFQDTAIGHRVAAAGQAMRPFVVGFFSTERPVLATFARGGRWATDVVLQASIDSTTDLAEVVAAALFPQPSARVAAQLYRETPPVDFSRRAAAAAPPRDTSARREPSCNFLDVRDPCIGTNPADPRWEARRRELERRQTDTVPRTRRPPPAPR
jgi:hypothetical protein